MHTDHTSRHNMGQTHGIPFTFTLTLAIPALLNKGAACDVAAHNA
ncbi:hypothetical protein AOR13_2186 [Alteromonas stellipolaris LMG 21856]|nr:hypothetical protein AOR13_2186 [Alteromonas stellipolaris LMG 21856]